MNDHDEQTWRELTSQFDHVVAPGAGLCPVCKAQVWPDGSVDHVVGCPVLDGEPYTVSQTEADYPTTLTSQSAAFSREVRELRDRVLVALLVPLLTRLNTYLMRRADRRAIKRFRRGR